uniref:Casein kinase substrate phosphoprotein PP28 domain-containing protein n=2 Tax=Ciona intestinalis TaxID=7719 RepID=F6SLJ7_CIOIN
MPRGGKRSQKGRARQFTSVDELESQRKQEQNWRKKQDSSSDEDTSEEEEKSDINNPNRVINKTKKASQLDEIVTTPTTDLSRREKEQIAKQEAQRRYQQLHAQGKTDEARADLARLAIIRKQREEAAQKREAEKKAKEERLHASKEASLNAIKGK